MYVHASSNSHSRSKSTIKPITHFIENPPLPLLEVEGKKSQTKMVGCCCDEEEEQLLQPLNSPQHQEASSSSSTARAVTGGGGRGEMESTQMTISPMNSNFSALLCGDTLRAILERLPLDDLARAACVCRLWNSVASDRELQIRAFKSPWKLKDVVGNPANGSFWRDNSIYKFAISHRILRGDTIAGVAVKYSVQVMDIKRLNNMMSDHGIYSRERLLIPVNKPELLVNGTCYIELDTYAKREVAVLYLEGGPDGKPGNLLSSLAIERSRRRMIDSLKRSMHVDDGTAQYYLSVANGDPRAALTQFSEDMRWERQAGFAQSDNSQYWGFG